jgi:Rod binding domain-containing protein
MELRSGTADTLQYAGSLSADALVKGRDTHPPGKDDLAAKKATREFEALFVGMMLKSMRETVAKDPITDGGHGEEVYRSMLDQEYSRVISENGGVGLAAMLEKQLNATTGVSSAGRVGAGEYLKNSSGNVWSDR